MKKRFQLFAIAAILVLTSCGGSNKKGPGQKTESKQEANDGLTKIKEVVASLQGDIISEIGIIGKGTAEKPEGKYVTKYYKDSSKVIFSNYKTNADGAFEVEISTIMLADIGDAKADLTAMQDNADKTMSMTPDPFAQVSLVMVDEKNPHPEVFSSRSMYLMEIGLVDNIIKSSGTNIPMRDYKSAEDFVKKLKTVFTSK